MKTTRRGFLGRLLAAAVVLPQAPKLKKFKWKRMDFNFQFYPAQQKFYNTMVAKELEVVRGKLPILFEKEDVFFFL